MTKYFTTTLFVLMTISSIIPLSGQSCLPNGLTLFNQSDLDSFKVNYPACKEILGNVLIQNFSGSDISDLSILSQLEKIGGNLELSVVLLGDTTVSRLSDLSALDNLKEVGGDLNITKILADKITFAQLESIGGELSIALNKELITLDGFKALESVGELSIVNNDALREIHGFDQLASIDYNLNTSGDDDLSIRLNDELVEIFGFNNLRMIGSDVLIEENPILERISGFRNLERIANSFDLILNGKLSDLSGLVKLRSIGNDVTIKENALLPNLDFFSGLISVTGEFWLYKNNSLLQVDGLSNLTSVGDGIGFERNPVLESIYGIRNIDPMKCKGLGLAKNPLLADCQIRFVCELIALPDANYVIEENGVGCSSVLEIDCHKLGLSGFIYLDKNLNGIRDNEEFGIPNQRVIVSPGNFTVLTDENGQYYFIGDENETYNLQWGVNGDYDLTSSNFSYSAIFDLDLLDKDLDFGLKPSYTGVRGTVSLSSETTRCNTAATFHLRYRNESAFTYNGRVNLSYDALCQFIESDQLPLDHNINDNVVTWDFVSLLPFQYRDIQLEMQMPDEQQTGAPLNFSAKLTNGATMVQSLVDETEYNSLVLCSYDPNDKLVNPIGEAPLKSIEPGTKLNYTIRFQNTGNAAAINISIEDTLDQNLNYRTFKVTDSSFPVLTSMKGNAVKFDFRNIWLPDSTSNEPASHGFVSYEIEPKLLLPLGTEVDNTAAIYFDENPPIITNTTKTIYDISSATEEPHYASLELELFPNPTTDFSTLQINTLNSENAYLRVVTTEGKQIYSRKVKTSVGENKINLNTELWLPGLYYIEAQVGNKKWVHKIIKL